MRYIVFAYYTYYPSGGAGDIQGTYKGLKKATKRFEKCKDEGFEFVEIYDTLTETIIQDVSPRRMRKEEGRE